MVALKIHSKFIEMEKLS